MLSRMPASMVSAVPNEVEHTGPIVIAVNRVSDETHALRRDAMN
jgi:hypothetical protein